jgi:hypothetical protein
MQKPRICGYSASARLRCWRCPRPESNQRTRFRKPLLYPLSYGGRKSFGEPGALSLLISTVVRFALDPLSDAEPCIPQGWQPLGRPACYGYRRSERVRFAFRRLPHPFET